MDEIRLINICINEHCALCDYVAHATFDCFCRSRIFVFKSTTLVALVVHNNI